jgi:predicted dinucleotide-binding enzyme
MKSPMERLQRAYPEARLVKALNSVGAGQMVNPEFAGERPTTFICGNDMAAKKTVEALLDQFGWESEDMEPVEAARDRAAFCMLWSIPGGARDDRSPHAFTLLGCVSNAPAPR